MIIHGMEEDRGVEDLLEIQDVAYDIGLSLYVDRTVRIGACDEGENND